jgi:hypothetical protein
VPLAWAVGTVREARARTGRADKSLDSEVLHGKQLALGRHYDRRGRARHSARAGEHECPHRPGPAGTWPVTGRAARDMAGGRLALVRPASARVAACCVFGRGYPVVVGVAVLPAGAASVAASCGCESVDDGVEARCQAFVAVVDPDGFAEVSRQPVARCWVTVLSCVNRVVRCRVRLPDAG